MCTGGHLPHWIRDRILRPPLLIQILCSFFMNSISKDIASFIVLGHVLSVVKFVLIVIDAL